MARQPDADELKRAQLTAYRTEISHETLCPFLTLGAPDEYHKFIGSAQQGFHLCQRLVQLGRILATAAGVVGLTAAFAADDGGDGLDNLAGLDFGGEIGRD